MFLAVWKLINNWCDNYGERSINVCRPYRKHAWMGCNIQKIRNAKYLNCYFSATPTPLLIRFHFRERPSRLPLVLCNLGYFSLIDREKSQKHSNYSYSTPSCGKRRTPWHPSPSSTSTKRHNRNGYNELLLDYVPD